MCHTYCSPSSASTLHHTTHTQVLRGFHSARALEKILVSLLKAPTSALRVYKRHLNIGYDTFNKEKGLVGAFSGHCKTVSEAVPVMAAVSVSALSPVSVVVQWAAPLTTSCLHWEVVVREVGER